MTLTAHERTGPGPGPGRIRILHLLPDLATGGGQTVVLNHVREADRGAFDVDVVHLSGPSEQAPAFRAAGVEPILLGHVDGQRVRTLVRLLRLVVARRPDLIHLHSGTDRLYGQLVALVTRTPVVYHLHGRYMHLGPAVDDPVHGVYVRRLDRIARPLYDRIEPRVVHHYAATSGDIADLFRPLVAAPVTVVPQAVPLAAFDHGRARRSRTRRALGLGEGDPMLVCVGRLVPGKGQADLVDLLAALPSGPGAPHLVLVGDGDRRQSLADHADRLGVADRVHLLGLRHDVPDLLGAADLFVFASRSEGFGLAVVEAQAAGLPVVAQRLPTIEAMVDASSGRLVDQHDVAAMAQAVQDLLADPDRRAAMGRVGRRRVEQRHPADATARALEAIYRRVTDAVAVTA